MGGTNSRRGISNMFIRNAARMEQDAPTGNAPGAQTGSEAQTTPPPARNQQPVTPNAPGGKPGDDFEAEDGGNFDIGSLDPRAQQYIKQLRKENAQRRTEANQLKTQFEDLTGRIKSVFGEEKNEAPVEQQLGQLQSTAETLAFQNAVLNMAVTNGIGAEGLPYMQFLLSQASESLEEGEEMDEDAIASIIEEVRSKTGGGRPGMGATSVNAPRGNASQQAEVTPEQFASMSLSEKTDLYRKNQNLYERLNQASRNTARKKR